MSEEHKDIKIYRDLVQRLKPMMCEELQELLGEDGSKPYGVCLEQAIEIQTFIDNKTIYASSKSGKSDGEKNKWKPYGDH